MKKIWSETVELAEGFDEATRNLRTQAWWDKKSGTLRIEIRVLDCGPYVYNSPDQVGYEVLFSTQETREEATREVIAQIDAAIVRHKPEAERAAALSIECGRWVSFPDPAQVPNL